jgi:hypothetical protein
MWPVSLVVQTPGPSRGIEAVKTDAFRVSVVQEFDGVAVEDANDWPVTLSREEKIVAG